LPLRRIAFARTAVNTQLLADAHERIAAGLTTWAECGGLLWTLDRRELVGAIPADAHMTNRLTLGSRAATARTSNPIAPTGAVLRGHEFNYSEIEPAGDALDVQARTTSRLGGFASPSLLATYIHLHLGASPAVAERFVTAARGRTSAERRSSIASSGAANRDGEDAVQAVQPTML
jgi:cobyrinic acid a,c-diamide synthase